MASISGFATSFALVIAGLQAVGAFMICGALIVLCGLWPALGGLITRIPTPLASAMLAGILFPICLATVTAMIDFPMLAWPIIVAWLVLSRLAPRRAVPAAMVAAAVVIALYAGGESGCRWQHWHPNSLSLRRYSTRSSS